MKFSVDQLQVLDVRSGHNVEVSYGEGGLKGIWYKAITESKSTRGLRKLSVRLLKDEFATPLDQLSKNVSVRPVPPHHLQVRIDLKEGCVVDAFHIDEWSTGLLIKEIEDQKYLVYFDSSPPDLIQVERKFLRPHLDWVFKKWWQVPKSESQLLERWREKSIFSPGTMVEVSSTINNVETVWAPALIVKEIAEEDNEKKYIVKFCNDVSLNCKASKANITIDSQSVRPKPPPFWVEEYKMFECVEVFHGSRWHKGILKGIISQKQYMVSLEVTKTHLIFDYSELRPLMEWENGVWKPVLALESGNKMVGSEMNGNTPSKEIVSMTTTSMKQTEEKTRGNTSSKKILHSENESIEDKENASSKKILHSENEPIGDKESSKDNSRKRKREETFTSVTNVEDPGVPRVFPEVNSEAVLTIQK